MLWFVYRETDAIIETAQFLWSRSAAAHPSLGLHEALLHSLYIVPEHWGEGIGTRLLHHGFAALPGAKWYFDG